MYFVQLLLLDVDQDASLIRENVEIYDKNCNI